MTKITTQELVQEIARQYASGGGEMILGFSPHVAFLHGAAMGALGAAPVDITELIEKVAKLQRGANPLRSIDAAGPRPPVDGARSWPGGPDFVSCFDVWAFLARAVKAEAAGIFPWPYSLHENEISKVAERGGYIAFGQVEGEQKPRWLVTADGRDLIKSPA